MSASTPNPDARFRREYRLRAAKDFAKVYAARARASDAVLRVLGAANGLEHARLGLSVSRKVGNSVVRHRWKRLVREAFRLERQQLPAGVDYVVIPQPGASVPSLAELRSALPALARRIARKLQGIGK